MSARNWRDSLLRNLIPRGFDHRLRTLSIALFLNEFGRSLFVVFLPLYYLTLGVPPLLIGLAITVSAGTSALFQVIGGVLSDSWGRRRSMLVSASGRVVLLGSLSIFATAIPSFIAIFLLITAAEALNGIFLTSSNAMISDLVEAPRRAEGFGIYRVAINFGFTFGSLFGGLMVLYTVSIYAWTLLVLLTLAILNYFLTETHARERTTFRLGNIISASRDRLLLTFSLVSVGAGLIANQMGPTFAIYSTQNIGISKQELGYLYFLNGILVILFQYGFSRLALRYRLSSLIAISVVVQSLSYLMVSFSNNLLLLQIVIVGLTIGEMLQAPAGTAFATAIAPDSRRGEYIGFYSWGWNSGQALSPIVGGFLLSLFAGSQYLTWYVIPIVGAFCTIAYLFIGVTARRSNPSQGRTL